eukprot:jgi/Tetstr1/436049/TSEL_024928.t1
MGRTADTRRQRSSGSIANKLRSGSSARARDQNLDATASREQQQDAAAALLAAALTPMALGSSPIANAEQALPPTLPVDELPLDVLHRLFTLLPVASVVLLSQTSRRLAATARDERASPAPHSYRLLYHTLHHHQPLIGGALVRMPFQAFGQAGDAAEVDFLDGSLCMIKEAPGPGMRRSDSGGRMKAEAAAAVAGGTGVDQVLGSSPQGTFGHEFMRFMQANVDPGRRVKKKSPGRRCSWAAPVTHHLVRLSVSKPSYAHPLVGLWAACSEHEELQIVNISYCFSGSKATIVAVKVIGNDSVPAGERLWDAAAAPLESLPPAEVAHIAEADHSSGAGATLTESSVESVHRGRGLARQFAPLQRGFVDGRLWQYQGGDLGFCWLANEGRSVLRFRRLEQS